MNLDVDRNRQHDPVSVDPTIPPAIPLSGLINCLSTPRNGAATTISMLCNDGVRLLSPSASTSIPSASSSPLRADGILHAVCTPTILCTVARSQANQQYQLEITNLSTATVAVIPPLLHFQPRSLSSCIATDGTLTVVVGGYDGAYVSQRGNALRVLPGCQGFPVCVVKVATHGIAVALVDGRVAVWNSVNSSPHTLIQMPAAASCGPGDRVTDVTFTNDRLVIAYWSGLVAIYDRNNGSGNSKEDDDDAALGWKHKEICCVWTTKGQAVSESSFFKRGPTVIVEGCDGEDVIAVVDGSGCIAFVDVNDGACVRREILLKPSRAVKTKGACALGSTVVVWVTDSNDLVSVDWPSAKELSVARRVAKEVQRRLKACA